MTKIEPSPGMIAEAINAIMGEVTYVQKRGENQFHRYKFAAVGDLLAKVQPAMHKHGLIIIQNEKRHTLSPSGGVMEVEYEFTIAHKSGVVWPDRPVHTGMAAATNSKGGFDDKCVNKCMTAARKYFLLALFQIPTGEQDDPDAHEDTTEPAAKRDPSPPIPPKQAPAQNGAPGEGTFLLVAPNDKIVSRHERPSHFLDALEKAMEDGDDPQAWWMRNKELALGIGEQYPKAAGEVIHRLQTMADDYGKEIAA